MKTFKFPKIGLRTLKTALATFLCLLLFPNEPFFACITSIFCLQDTVSNTIKIAIDRFLGTSIGAICGLISLVLFQYINSFLSNEYIYKITIYILMSIGVMIMILICNFIKKPGATRLTCIVFLAVTTVTTYPSPLYYASNRIVETVFGILISLVVNILIKPPKNA